jgi:hypothetical protein
MVNAVDTAELHEPRGLVGHLAQPYQTMNMMNQTQKNSTNPWNGQAFCIT